jgi:hypothetical protein
MPHSGAHKCLHENRFDRGSGILRFILVRRPFPLHPNGSPLDFLRFATMPASQSMEPDPCLR